MAAPRRSHHYRGILRQFKYSEQSCRRPRNSSVLASPVYCQTFSVWEVQLTGIWLLVKVLSHKKTGRLGWSWPQGGFRAKKAAGRMWKLVSSCQFVGKTETKGLADLREVWTVSRLSSKKASRKDCHSQECRRLKPVGNTAHYTVFMSLVCIELPI